MKKEIVVALAGNPNTGKSTVFNALTGLKQHTGNWAGKTVQRAEGIFEHKGFRLRVVDLPGTYSLMANSQDEQVARDFICFEQPDVTIVVVDATSLERNLNLVLQVMEITSKVVLCLNLMDEAYRKGIRIDIKGLSKELGIPVIPTSARRKEGLEELKDMVLDVATGKITPTPNNVQYDPEIEDAVLKLIPELESLLPSHLDPRWVALRLLSNDSEIIDSIQLHLKSSGLESELNTVKKEGVVSCH